MRFYKTWVAFARGEADQVTHPEFISAMLFPLKDDLRFDATAITTKNSLTKRFVFNASVIESIRLKYQNNERSIEDHDHHILQPSQFEALPSFIWNCFVAATSDERTVKSEKGYAMVHTMNLRPRLDLPLLECSFGNLSRCSIIILSTGEEYGSELARLIREGITKVDMAMQ